MPNDVNLFAFPIVRLTLAYLLHSTLLLGGTWLFLRVARVRSWALRERMWKLAVIVPLITAAMPLPAAWSRSAGRLSFERFVPELPSAESDVAQVEEPKRVPIVAAGLSADVDKTLDVDDAPRAAALTAICYTVLTFFILGTLHVIRRSLVFARSLRDCRPVLDESICAVLADVLYRANVRRRVRLLVSAADRAPAAFGIFRWTIVLPQALIPTLKPDELRALLGHEVAHLARGDALWLWIGRILCACCAFQPLNFLARAQLRLAAEFLSDEWAVRNSANRFALARCLTRVAEWSAHLEPQSLELAAVGSRSNLSDRVERLILEPRRTDFWDVGRRRWLVWAA